MSRVKYFVVNHRHWISFEAKQNMLKYIHKHIFYIDLIKGEILVPLHNSFNDAKAGVRYKANETFPISE